MKKIQRQTLQFFLVLLMTFWFSISLNAQWKNYPQHGYSFAAAVEGNAIWQVTSNGLIKRDLNGNLLEEHIYDRFSTSSSRYYLGATTDMTIDANGYKWIALGSNSSYQALVKFDGTDWTFYPRSAISGSPGSYIHNVEATPDGKLYADNYTEVLQFDGTAWSVMPNNPHDGGTIRDLTVSATGEVAVAYDQQVLTYSPAAGWQVVYSPSLPGGVGYFGAVAYNAQNELHVVYYSGEVYKLVNGTATLVTTNPFGFGYVTTADFSPNNELYVGNYDSSGSGAFRWNGNTWTDLSASVIGFTNDDPTFFKFDNTGGVWFGTEGLRRYKNNQVSVYRNGIVGGDWNINEGDAAGDWVFASNGDLITKYNKTTKNSTYFTSADYGFANINGSVQTLAAEPSGNFYIALWRGGIKYYNGSTFQTIANAPLNTIKMDLAPNGTLYTAETYHPTTYLYSGLWAYQNGTWTNYNVGNSAIPSNEIRDIFVDTQNRVWLATDAGLARFQNGTFTTWNTGNSAIASENIKQVAGTDDGSTIWFHNQFVPQLQRLQNGTFTLGAPNTGDNYSVLAVDNQGNAWMTLTHDGNGLGLQGIVKVTPTSVTHHGGFASQQLDTWDGTVFNDHVGGVWFVGGSGAANYIGSSNLAIALSTTPLTCNGSTDGSVSASITGGTAPYEFFWYKYGYPNYFYGDEEYFHSMTANGLPPVNMDFYVRDANGCTAGGSIIVTQPQQVRVTVSGSGNALTAAPTGGITPYQFAWSNGANTASATNLSDGSYVVTITDANGCTATATGFVGTVPPIGCNSSNNIPWSLFISNVELGTINNSTSKDAGNPFYNTQSTNLEKGSAQDITVSVSYPYASNTFYVRAWIDWNRNGAFEASEIVLDKSDTGVNNSASAFLLSNNFTVPTTAQNGTAMMRVIVKAGSAPDPCDTGIAGEVENYPVFIKNGGTGNPCSISAAVSNIQCSNNGTPNTPLDDMYTFDMTVSKTGTCGSTWSGGGTTGTYGVAKSFGPYPILNGNKIYTFTDSANPSATATVTANAPAPCSTPTGGTCTNNLLQNPSYSSGSGSWSGNVVLTTDAKSVPNAAKACTAYLPIRQTVQATPNTTYNLEVFAKKDANTTGLVVVKFLNSSWSPLSSEFLPIGSTSYALITKSVTAPANTAWVEVSLLKDGGAGCVYADDWCLSTGGGGNPCSISATVQNIQCNNNGTDQNPNDDRFTFDLLVTGSNTGSGWTGFVQGVPKSGTYGVAQPIGVYNIASGNVTFTINDVSTPSCTASATAIAPAPCSNPSTGTCTGDLLQNSGFNSFGAIWTINGTGAAYVNNQNSSHAYVGTTAEICQTGTRIYQTVNVTGGKTYTLQAQAKRTQNARGLLVIKYLDASWTPLLQDFHTVQSNTYTLESMTLAAPAGAVRAEISFFHNGGTGCVYADDFCFSENGGGTSCSISATVSNIQCSNNGTPNTPLDDMFTFDVTVTKTGTCGATWTGGGTTGTYGVAKSFGPYPILNGNKIFTFTDAGNSAATATVTAQTPAPCSNGSGNMPDLTVENLNLSGSTAAVGSVVNYNFDLKNIGTALANGNFSIKSYLSTDQTLSNNDVQDGAIPTGFVVAGQIILQTPGALTVPNSLPNGTYWVLLKVDADNQIAESNENNNVTVSVGQLTVTGGGGGNKPDLALTASASPLMPGQWKNTSITLTLTNTGTVAATGVEVTTPASMNTIFRDKMAYVSHNTAAGNYNDWLGKWTVGTLDAGASVTLTYNGFTKIAGPIAYFAQVSAQSPEDADSAPNNNASGMPFEDDEALVEINGSIPFIIGNQGKQTSLFDELNVIVYPNPASSHLMVNLINFKEKSVDMRMMDAYGRVVLEKLNIKESLEYVDLSAVQNGSYMLQLRSEQNRPVLVKVVVEKGH